MSDVARKWSTAVSGTAQSYMDFTFDRDYNFNQVVVENGMPSGQINYYV